MKKNIFFIDLDGTLLDQTGRIQHYISDPNINAIENIKSKGYKVFLSTGRSGINVAPYLENIDSEYAILANGAIVQNKKGEIVRKRFLELRDVILLREFLIEHNFAFKINDSLKGYNCNSKFKIKKSVKWGAIPITHSNIDFDIEFYKFVIWGKDKLKMRMISKTIMKKFTNMTTALSVDGFFLEITHKEATKGLANLWVVKKIKGDIKMAVHIGDSPNDLSVVNYMDFIAMKNAKKNIKKRATIIGPSYLNGGVSKILSKFY